MRFQSLCENKLYPRASITNYSNSISYIIDTDLKKREKKNDGIEKKKKSRR